MEYQDFLNLIEAAKRDKNKIKSFKLLAVDCQQFSLAADLRDIERELFPESKEVIDAKTEASKLNLVFRMVGLDVPDRVAWVVNQTLKKHWKRRGNFDLKDASTIRAKAIEYFGEQQ